MRIFMGTYEIPGQARDDKVVGQTMGWQDVWQNVKT